MKKIGIIGGAGYTAGELLRILIHHPKVKIEFVHSTSNAGNKISAVHGGLIGDTDLVFTDKLALDTIDALIFCVAHGDTKKFLDANEVPKGLKIIDLSTDYRKESADNDFVYGLPELNRERIKTADKVANPGCFATAIQLTLLPLAKAGLLKSEVHVNAVTGSTGAGQKPSATSHFSWRNDNISVYKAFEHQHLAEIKQSLTQLQSSFDVDINFIPVRGNFSRGIFCSMYTECSLSLDEAKKLYTDFYADAVFTHVADENIDLKQVVNTNKGLVHIEKHGNKILVLSAIDNLLKGASGQAVQNMNLVFGFDENMGLNLKPIGF